MSLQLDVSSKPVKRVRGSERVVTAGTAAHKVWLLALQTTREVWEVLMPPMIPNSSLKQAPGAWLADGMIAQH